MVHSSRPRRSEAQRAHRHGACVVGVAAGDVCPRCVALAGTHRGTGRQLPADRHRHADTRRGVRRERRGRDGEGLGTGSPTRSRDRRVRALAAPHAETCERIPTVRTLDARPARVECDARCLRSGLGDPRRKAEGRAPPPVGPEVEGRSRHRSDRCSLRPVPDGLGAGGWITRGLDCPVPRRALSESGGSRGRGRAGCPAEGPGARQAGPCSV